jgi:hypothetical protein
MIRKCQDCGTWVFCPRPVCGDCASDKLEWIEVSGKGKIFAFTIIREVVGQALRGFAPDIPYVTAWIDLDEGRVFVAISSAVQSTRSISICRCKSFSKTAATESHFQSSSRRPNQSRPSEKRNNPIQITFSSHESSWSGQLAKLKNRLGIPSQAH